VRGVDRSGSKMLGVIGVSSWTDEKELVEKACLVVIVEVVYRKEGV